MSEQDGHHRPIVTTSTAMTVDGRILDWGLPIDAAALAQLGGPGAICERLDPGVVLTGADTLWPFPGNPVWPAGIDRPSARASVGPSPDDVPIAEPRPEDRWLAITDSRGRLPDDWFTSFLSDGAIPPWPGGPTGPLGAHHRGRQLVVLVSETTPAGFLDYLRARRIRSLVAGPTRVDLALALHLLATRLGVEQVLVDGGSQLHHALLAAGLVDHVHVEIAPVILGSPGMTAFQVEGLRLPEGIVLDAEHVEVSSNGTIAARFRVR